MIYLAQNDEHTSCFVMLIQKLRVNLSKTIHIFKWIGFLLFKIFILDNMIGFKTTFSKNDKLS